LKSDGDAAFIERRNIAQWAWLASRTSIEGAAGQLVLRRTS